MGKAQKIGCILTQIYEREGFPGRRLKAEEPVGGWWFTHALRGKARESREGGDD